MDHEPVPLQPRSAFPSGENLADAGAQLPGELLVPPARPGGQCLEPVPPGAQPGQLGVVLPAGRDVRGRFPDPVADLLKLVLVAEAP